MGGWRCDLLWHPKFRGSHWPGPVLALMPSQEARLLLTGLGLSQRPPGSTGWEPRTETWGCGQKSPFEPSLDPVKQVRPVLGAGEGALLCGLGCVCAPGCGIVAYGLRTWAWHFATVCSRCFFPWEVGSSVASPSVHALLFGCVAWPHCGSVFLAVKRPLHGCVKRKWESIQLLSKPLFLSLSLWATVTIIVYCIFGLSS